MPRQLTVAVFNGRRDPFMRPEHLGRDFPAGLRSQTLDLVETAEANEDQSDELEGTILCHFGDGGMEVVDGLDAFNVTRTLLSPKRLVQRFLSFIVDSLGRQVCNADFDAGPHLCQLGKFHASPGQVDGSHLRHRIDGWLNHEEAASWTPTHAGDLVVFEKANGLSKHGSTHTPSLDELCFRAHQFTRRKPFGHDGLG